MKKNIIVVTGGAGFIGSSLIKYFVENKFKEKIISIDNYSTGNKKNHVQNNNVILRNMLDSIQPSNFGFDDNSSALSSFFSGMSRKND